MEFKPGDLVIYAPKDAHGLIYDKQEIGIVTSINESGNVFVRYNTGDTSACTPKEFLELIDCEKAKNLVPNQFKNKYAFYFILGMRKGYETFCS